MGLQLVRNARKRVGAVAVLTALGLIASGCGWIDVRREAEQIVSAPSKAKALGTASGTLSYTFEPRIDARVRRAQELEGGAGEAEEVQRLQQQLNRMAVRSVPIEIDFANERAQMLGEDGEPTMIFDGTAMFTRRLGADLSRPWVKLDFRDLEPRREGLFQDQEETTPVGLIPINPALMVEFISGSLSGSIEPVRREMLHGVQADRYEVTVDWWKAESGEFRRRAGLDAWPDDKLEGLARIREAMRLTNLVTPGAVSIDSEGLPRRFVWTLEQRVQLQPEGMMGGPEQGMMQLTLLDTRVTLDLLEFGTGVEVAVPSGDELLVAESLAEMLRELTPDMDQLPGDLGDFLDEDFMDQFDGDVPSGSGEGDDEVPSGLFDQLDEE